MHLQIAEQIYEAVADAGNGRLQATLTAAWPAFYLGSVAPDVNAISSMPRVSTHFYDVPPAPEETAYRTMLDEYPQLTRLTKMSPDQAVCVAAYCAHLMLDLIWLREVFFPLIYLPDNLGDPRQRHLTHFILLTHLDTLALASLPKTAVATLGAARPDRWFPFIEDAILVAWQEMLLAQLQPGAAVKTIEIYAGRLKMSSSEFAANLQNEAWMQKQVFDKIPVNKVVQILQAAVPQSVRLIRDYLQIGAGEIKQT